jgi:hypothetical protein
MTYYFSWERTKQQHGVEYVSPGETSETPHLICNCSYILSQIFFAMLQSQKRCRVVWEFVYILSNNCTLDNTLKMFQYKLLHRTIPTNTFLYKCRLVETELCAFCGETREIIMHLFCD